MRTRQMIKQLLFLSLTLSVSAQVDSEKVAIQYPEYKENETLVFRSGVGLREKGGGITYTRDKFGVVQYRIPDLTRTPDGRLVGTVIGRCSAEGDHSISTSFFAVSKDEGKTWEKITFSTDFKNLDKRPQGDFPMTERTQETQVVWYPAMNKFVAIYLSQSKAWFVTSSDLKSWSQPQEAKIDMPGIRGYWPSPSSLQIDKDGSLLFAITGHDGPKREDCMARLVWTKDLKNFEVSPKMPVRGNETAVIPISGGKYLVSTRIKPNRLNMTYDRTNKTWGEPVPFPAPHRWKCEVDLVSDGKSLYMATPLTPLRHQGRLYRSDDEGKTWKEIAKLTGSEYFGYSALVILKNGDVGILAERAFRRGTGKDKQPVYCDIVFHRVKTKE